jgi:hypothetical protein
MENIFTDNERKDTVKGAPLEGATWVNYLLNFVTFEQWISTITTIRISNSFQGN